MLTPYILLFLVLCISEQTAARTKEGKSRRTENDRPNDYIRRKVLLQNALGRNIRHQVVPNIKDTPDGINEKTGPMDTRHRPNNKKNGKGKGLGVGHMFDHPEDIPASSELEDILESQVVVNGKHQRRPKGTKPEHKQKLQGDNLDRHLFVDEDDETGRKRKFIETTSDYWSKAIVPYVIDTSYSVAEKGIILQAIQQFHDLTCVQWIPLDDPRNTKENLGHSVYVRIEDGIGCSSYVGNVARLLKDTNYEYQQVTLDKDGCVSVGTAVHEMMHAIGAHHEQGRSDRDQYVDIQYQNMHTSSYSAFTKHETINVHPYDASSDMHYGLRTFSSNGGQTLRMKNHVLEFLADIADGFSFYDTMDINTAYNCSGTCPAKDCKNAGYVNGQCNCYCPDLLTGEFCEQTVGACGGIVNVPAGQEVFITTPNYPNNYDSGLQCNWLIQGEPNNILRGTIVDMEISNNDNACYHWIEIRFNLLGQIGPKRCGQTTFEEWDATPDEYMNKMIINFDSFVGSDEAVSRGFKMKFESIGTGCVDNPCKFGLCHSPLNTNTYTCTCDPGFSGTNCEILTGPVTVGCSAEYGDYCMLKQDEVSDDFDFDFASVATDSLYTGPAHAKEGYEYLYAEASSPRQKGDRAVMYTDINFQSSPRCLRFWYHMYGSGMGTLNIYTENSAGTKMVIFSEIGNHGDQWNEASISIPAMNGLKITFESIVGTSSRSDIGIDGVLLQPGPCENPCNSSPCQNNGQCTPNLTDGTSVCACASGWTGPLCDIKDKPDTINIACDFETVDEQCIFDNIDGDDFDWTRNFGKTSSVYTGPQNGYSGDYYMYIETSSPRIVGDKAILTTSNYQLPGNIPYCMHYAYHMFGNPGELIIRAGERNQDLVEVHRFSGNQEDIWHTSTVQIPQFTDTVISIEGTRGPDYKGDIAIDHILVQTGSCFDSCGSFPCLKGGACTSEGGSYICACKTGTMGSNCQFIDKTSETTFECSFEDNDGYCIFKDSLDDVFDWTRLKGATVSAGTGPTQASLGTNYKYIEASAPRIQGDFAILDTSMYKLPVSTFCLTFDYHMYGNPGNLVFTAVERNGVSKTQLTLTGDHGNQWFSTSFDIPQYNDVVIYINGTVGPTFKGDIAVDNLRLTTGTC